MDRAATGPMAMAGNGGNNGNNGNGGNNGNNGGGSDCATDPTAAGCSTGNESNTNGIASQ